MQNDESQALFHENLNLIIYPLNVRSVRYVSVPCYEQQSSEQRWLSRGNSSQNSAGS